jgi:glycosyltransferase involved in cell wall biosynthesis
MGQPVVSVIIPLYNEEEYVAQCIDSVLAQSLKEIEIICIDDGSTDGTLRRLQAYGEADPRVRVLTQPNLGPGVARNKGIECAKGEFVAFLDADDSYCDNRALEKLCGAAREHGVLAASGRLLYDVYSTVRMNSLFETADFDARGRVVSFAEYQNPLGYQAYILSRTMLLENDIRFPALLRYQDPPFLARALYAAKDVFALPIPFYAYRMGHRPLHWSFEKVNDLVLGLTDCLTFSAAHGLETLHRRTVSYFDIDYFWLLFDSLVAGNPRLPELLLKANAEVNADMTRFSGSPAQPFRLQVLQSMCHNAAKAPLAKLAEAKKIVYYGAGNKGRQMISTAVRLHGKYPDMIWDANAGAIGTVAGRRVSAPDFSLLREDWDLILCVVDPDVSRSVRLSCEAYGFINILDWYDVQREYLHMLLKDTLQPEPVE